MSFTKRRSKIGRLGTPIMILIVVGVLIFGMLTVWLAYTPVKYGTVALIARFGGLTGQVFEPGLHWRIPFVDRLVVVPTVIQSYETSDHPELSGADYRDYPVNAQTTDGQQVTIKYTVLFRIPPERASHIVQNIGRPQEIVENIVKAHSRNLTRLWAQNYTAEELYSGEGIFEYESKVQSALVQEFEKYGVNLDDFLVRKVEFDEDYIKAIEEQQIAQEAIETAKYQADAAEYEKERQIRLAEAEAERTKLQAQAEAERQRLLADAEAYGIKARGEALQEFPNLVQWEFVRNLQDIQWGILPGDGITPLVPIHSFESRSTLPTPQPTPTPPPTPTPSGEGQ